MNKLYGLAGIMLALSLWSFGVYHITHALDGAKYQKILNVELVKEANLSLNSEQTQLTIDQLRLQIQKTAKVNIPMKIQTLYKYLPTNTNNACLNKVIVTNINKERQQ